MSRALQSIVIEATAVVETNERSFDDANERLVLGAISLDEYKRTVLELLASYSGMEKRLRAAAALARGKIRKELQATAASVCRVTAILSVILVMINRGEVIENTPGSDDPAKGPV